MSKDNRYSNPANFLWVSITKGTVQFLLRHKIIRIFAGTFGLLFFIIGCLTAVIWNIPILSWLYGKNIAIPALAAGGYLLGVWFLSKENSDEDESL